jgi:hypothetical protein
MGTKVKPVQPTEIKDKKIAREVIEQIRKPIPASVYKRHEKLAEQIDKMIPKVDFARSDDNEFQRLLRLYQRGCLALGKPCGKLKGLHNIFPFNVGIIGKQFFNGLSRADLGNYPSDSNPRSPDTGFAPHDGGVRTDTIQMSVVHDMLSIFLNTG